MARISLALAVGFVAALGVRAAESPDFHSDVRLVKVETYVYDKVTKAPISGLKQSDFAIFDGDEQRPIAWFSSDSGPLDLMLLLDVSGSMRQALPRVAVQADIALKTLRDRDRAGVIAFGAHCEITQDLTGDFDAVTKGILRTFLARVGGDTDISTAIRGAAKYMAGYGGTSKRGILIVTDNEQVTTVPDEEVEKALFDADTVLDAVIVHGGLPMPHLVHPGVLRFVPKTGGEVVEGNHPDELIAEMIERIRARYSIHFQPVKTDSKAARRIRVELTAAAMAKYPNAAIRARKSYFPN